jgi:hypothetical protein
VRATWTKARYGFVYGDFRRVHRTGLIACQYRAAEWRHKEVELAAHDLLQELGRQASLRLGATRMGPRFDPAVVEVLEAFGRFAGGSENPIPARDA